MRNTEANTEFKRKARVGISPLSCNEKNPTVMIKIVSKTIETFTKKNGKTIQFVAVTNLQTGEHQTFWLSGQVRYNLEQLENKYKGLNGIALELIWKGTETVEIDGEDAEVNQYDIFELEA